jgi:hypothetical protein
LDRYTALVDGEYVGYGSQAPDPDPWDEAMRRIKVEMDTLANIAKAAGAALELEAEPKADER